MRARFVTWLLVASFPWPASASDERALLLARGLPESDARALSRALGDATSRTIVPLDRALAELEERARSLGDDEVRARRDAALARARASYVELRLDDAREAYDAALEAELASERAAADSRTVARILFERALVLLAAQRESDAMQELRDAVILDPDLAPDPDVYGPPVFRALDRARAEVGRLPPASVRVNVAPAGARVTVAGRPLGDDGTALVPRGIRHLVTAEAFGHVPVSRWVTASSDEPVSIDLARASRALVAAQALGAYESDRDATAIARATSASLVIRATPLAAPAHYRLVARSLDGEERTAEGGPVDWEILPYTVLAAAVTGRRIAPPPAGDVELAVDLPQSVSLAAPIAIDVSARGGAGALRALVATCGDGRDETVVAGERNPSVELSIAAPASPGHVDCSVFAVDEVGRVRGRAPADGPFRVLVAEPQSWYAQWYVWTAVGVAVLGGAALALLLTRDDANGPEMLVIGGPE